MEIHTKALREGKNLTAARLKKAGAALLDESISAEVKADFLRAFSEKGETPDEIAALVDFFLLHAVDPGIVADELDGPLIDVCGTGGDNLGLFNISTTVTMVLTGGGCFVAKHGNRGVTSRSGGADVLEVLGINIDLPPESAAECLAECGTVFLYAPTYHPAFKAVAAARKLLAQEGRKSVFNLLGPLLNPARPPHQLVGVYDPKWVQPFASILKKLGRKTAWAVNGAIEEQTETMDEVSSLGVTTVASSNDPSKTFRIDPEELGYSPTPLDDLQGGDAVDNANLLLSILDGTEDGPCRDIVELNAAAGFAVAGLAEDIHEGLALARESISSGAARDVVEKLREFAPLE